MPASEPGRRDLLASEVSTLAGSRVTPAIAASTIDRTMNRPPRIAVERVRKSAAPRAVMNPDELPPTPSPPPSERCIRMTATSEAATTVWTISRKVNMAELSGRGCGASRRSARGASTGAAAASTIGRKSAALRLAPPTSAPSTSGTAKISAAFEALTEPP